MFFWILKKNVKNVKNVQVCLLNLQFHRPLNRSNFTITLNLEAFVILLRLIDPINQIVQQRLRH